MAALLKEPIIQKSQRKAQKQLQYNVRSASNRLCFLRGQGTTRSALRTTSCTPHHRCSSSSLGHGQRRPGNAQPEHRSHCTGPEVMRRRGQGAGRRNTSAAWRMKTIFPGWKVWAELFMQRPQALRGARPTLVLDCEDRHPKWFLPPPVAGAVTRYI